MQPSYDNSQRKLNVMKFCFLQYIFIELYIFKTDIVGNFLKFATIHLIPAFSVMRTSVNYYVSYVYETLILLQVFLLISKY